MSERFCIDVGDDPGFEPGRSHLARAGDELGYRDLDHYDRDQDLRAEGGEPKPFAPSQRDMVTASLLADDIKACHRSSYARRNGRADHPAGGGEHAQAQDHRGRRGADAAALAAGDRRGDAPSLLLGLIESSPAPQPGAPTAAAASPRADGTSSPNGRRAHHAAPGGSPSTNATPAGQG